MNAPDDRRAVTAVRRPYCLRCYAPMPREPGASHHCAACGELNLEIDQQLRWTCEPRFQRLELVLKVLIALFVGWMSVLLLGARQFSFGIGQGWAAGGPVVVGMVLWQTASKVTRRTPEFRAGLFWALLFGTVGGLLLLFGILAACQEGAGEYRPVVAAVIGIACLLLLAALGAARFDRALRRWQDAYVSHRQRNGRNPAAA